MFFRLRISLALAALLSLVLVVPVFAGGWAVITLDDLPSNVVAGEPITIGFSVLQHGQTPMTNLSPTVTAHLSGEKIVVTARPDGMPGHYTADLIFPKEGEWRWSIQAFTMNQNMPMLSVSPSKAAVADPVVAKTEPASTPLSPLTAASIGTLVLGVAGAVIAVQRKSRPVMALTALCLLAGVVLLLAGAGAASRVEAQAKSDPEVEKAAVDPSVSQVELGRQLFIAKGCITCHVNSKAASPSAYLTIEMGATNLTNFSASPEVLFIRLKDPAAAKSDTKMPNLGLKETEIEALIAFINSK